MIFKNFYFRRFQDMELDENQFGFGKRASCGCNFRSPNSPKEGLEKEEGYAVFFLERPYTVQCIGFRIDRQG